MTISMRSFFAFVVLGCVLGFACVTSAQEAQEGRLLRFPDIYKDKIAFMYGGDLWLASSSGGTARRITSHPRAGTFPKVFAGREMAGIHWPVRRQL